MLNKENLMINVEGTIIALLISNYKKTTNIDDEDWCKVSLHVKNKSFDYKIDNSEILTSLEVDYLKEQLNYLVNNKIKEKLLINFLEPDLSIILYPKFNIKEDENVAWVKKGYEIQDIYLELHINIFLDRCLTSQKYIITFNRKDVEALLKYLNDITEKY